MSYQVPNGFIPYPNNPDLYYSEQTVYDQSGNQFREITYFSVSTGQAQVNHYPVENVQQAPTPQYQVQNNSAAVKTAPKKSRAGLFITLSIIILLIAGGLTMWLTGTYKMLPFFGSSGIDVESKMNFAMGNSHSVFLLDDGTVVATGNNEYGQCDVETWTDIIAVDAGGTHTVGLKSDGTVVATGYNDDERCNVEDWTDIIQIGAGALGTIGLKSDGTVVNTDADSEYMYSAEYTNDWTDINNIGLLGSVPIAYTNSGKILIARDFSQEELDIIDLFTDVRNVRAFSILGDEGMYVDYYILFKNSGEVSIEITDSSAEAQQSVEMIKEKIDFENIADIVINGYMVVVYKDGTVGVFDVLNEFEEYYAGTDDWTDIVAVECFSDNIIGLKSDGTYMVVGTNENGQLNLEEIGIPVS